MKGYRCPVCKKLLTRKQYERALGILEAKQEHLRHQEANLRRQLREAKREKRTARREGIELERARTKRLLQGKTAEIQQLKERINQLKRGTTPQTEGLEFEDKLAARLRREFPDDKLEHKGKGGDVLHAVRFDGKVAGTIIYECKRTPRIQSAHIRQAQKARRTREADFAVLVTTGRRRGFSGFAEQAGVLLIAPLGVIALAGLLRHYLIEMMRASVTREKRTLIARQLLKFISSPQFKNPIEGIVETATELQEMVRQEAKDHVRVWKRRWDAYSRVHWDGSSIRENVQLVIHGKHPKALRPPSRPRLMLPVLTE